MTQERGGGTVNSRSYNQWAIDEIKRRAAAQVTKPNPGQPRAQAEVSTMGYNLDPMVMAASQFAPQYALLDQLARQNTANYTKAGNDVGGMWDALSKQIRGQEGSIKKNYSDTGSAIGKAYNQATAATDNSFSQSRDQIAEIAKRLGVEAGVPSALEGGAEQQGRLSALINAEGANYQGLNAALGNNDVSYNRENADTARFAGVNARSDFKSKLQQALSDLGNKRLELKSDEGAAANKYGLDIAGMQQEAELARQKMAADAQGDQYKQAELELNKARFGLDQDKFLASQNRTADTSKMSPYELVAQLASKLYNNPQSQSNATNAITDTLTRGYQGDRSWNSANDFVQDVLARNPRANDYRQLQQMALEFYSRLAGGADKPYRS